MSGIIGKDRSKSGRILRGSDVLSGATNWGSLLNVNTPEITFVDGSTSPTVVATFYVDGASNRDHQSKGIAPRNGRPIVIDVSFNLTKSYNGNRGYYMDMYIAGGSFGTGFVSGDAAATIAASTFATGELTKQVADNTYKWYNFRIVDMNPVINGVNPVYTLMRVGTPSITYTFNTEKIRVWEVGMDAL